MTEEGYYEEPMKWTTNCRDADAVYENESRSRDNLDHLEPDIQIENAYSYYECPKVRNGKILFAVFICIFLSTISLIVVIQYGTAVDSEFTKIGKILNMIQKNLTLPTSTRPTVTTTTALSTESPMNETCVIAYRGKCFTLLKHLSNITLSEAREGCRNINGKLANIYNLKLFIQISSLLKSSLPPGSQSTEAWTGMTVDIKTRKKVLSDLSYAPSNIPWYPGRQFAKKLPYLGIYIRSTINLYARGMYDAKSIERFHTAVCEIDIKPCSEE